MRKILKEMAMVTLCAMLVGCGGTKTKEQTTEESQTVQEVVTEQITNEDIDGFCKPEYDKYNSYASDNGLGDTPI